MKELPDSNNLKEITRILESIELGSEQTDALIPYVYNELRLIANYRLESERPDQTLQATELVHEAYMRLSKPNTTTWKNQRHFLCVASEAMRKILIDNARRKMAAKRGGNPMRVDLEKAEIMLNENNPTDILKLNEGLKELEQHDHEAAEFVKLRFFVGLTIRQSAAILGISQRKANNLWAYTKSWLYIKLKD